MKTMRPLTAKFLSVALSLGLLLPSPTLMAQVINGSVVSGMGAVNAGSVAGAQVYQVNLPNLSVKPMGGAAPTLSASLPSAQTPVVNAAPAVERHPIIGLLNDLQAKGVPLPETADTPADAAKIVAAAQAMPAGPMRDQMLAAAKAITMPQGGASASASDAQAGQIGTFYDNSIYKTKKTAPLPMLETPAPEKGGFWSKLKRWGKPAPKAKPVEALSADNYEVAIEKLRWTPDVEKLPKSTSEIPASDRQIVGQDKALRALKFGLKMPGENYNVFVSGPDGSGRETAIKHVLDELAPGMPTPPDMVGVTNFADRSDPVILRVPTGSAPKLEAALKTFLVKMTMLMPQFLNSGEIGKAKKAMYAEVEKAMAERQKAFDEEVAQAQVGRFGLSIRLQRTKQGLSIVIAPTLQGKTLTPEDVKAKIAANELTQAEWDKAVADAKDAAQPFIEKLQQMLSQNQQDYQELQEKLSALESQAAAQVAQALGAPLVSAASDAKPVTHDDAAHKELEARSLERQQAFDAEVAAVRVGRFGILLRPMPTQKGIRMGIALTLDGAPVTPEMLQAMRDSGELSADEWSRTQAQIQEAAKPFTKKYVALLQQDGEEHAALHEGDAAAKPSADSQKAMEYFAAMVADAAKNYSKFMPSEKGSDEEGGGRQANPLETYKVSVIVNNSETKGAPVIWERNPSYENLFGSAEDNKRIMMIPGIGMVKSDNPGGPTLKGGSFHRANGGFLVLNVMDVLRQPGAWQSLMRAIRNGEAEIAEGGLAGAMSAAKGEKYPVASKVKVILVGSSMIKMQLAHYDEDFTRAFNASSSFESRLEIGAESLAGYLDFFKKMVVKGGGEILDMSREAMASFLEFSARLVESNEKLSAQFGAVLGRIREASFYAKEAGRKEITRADADNAIEQWKEREFGQQKSHMTELYGKDIFHVQTEGEAVGQGNALTIYGTFGIPSRASATLIKSVGRPGVEDLDDNVGWAGESYKAGVQNVQSFILSLFAKDENGKPQTFPATVRVKKEQLYGGIDGDSSTSTKDYIALSALSGVPIRQTIAYTGSADQYGNVQAIGGVNNKIEGWFDVLSMKLKRAGKDFDGTQGVIIPATNVGDLMLRPDIVEAVRQGKFHVWAVNHVSQGIEILTGKSYSEIVSKAQKTLKEMRESGKK